MIRSETEIRAKIQDSLEALKDFTAKSQVQPEDFFKVARQATYMTALYWVLNEDVPEEVTKLAVPIVKRMGEAQAQAAKKAEK